MHVGIEKMLPSIYKGISYKMLKDVGMTVPKSRETSAVYSYVQDEDSIIICSKTGNEGSILYAARQGMRACSNNNMRNPIIK